MYPWPRGEFDNVMDDALNIAMDYLIRTDQAINFRLVQKVAANAISDAWRAGVGQAIALPMRLPAIPSVEQVGEAIIANARNLMEHW